MELMPEQTTTKPEQTPKFKGRAKKGERRNPLGRRGKKKPVWVDPPRPEGLVRRPDESQLEAMRWVVMSEKDETIQQWEMRLWLRRDPKEFLAAKLTLERTANSSGSTAPENPGADSSGSSMGPVESSISSTPERAEVLIEKLLAEWEKR